MLVKGGPGVWSLRPQVPENSTWEILPGGPIELTLWGRDKMNAIFNRIFLNENVWISIKISLMFVPRGPINNIPALVQLTPWCWIGDKLLSEPMMVSLLMHICATWPQWVKLWCISMEGPYKIWLEPMKIHMVKPQTLDKMSTKIWLIVCCCPVNHFMFKFKSEFS